MGLPWIADFRDPWVDTTSSRTRHRSTPICRRGGSAESSPTPTLIAVSDPMPLTCTRHCDLPLGRFVRDSHSPTRRTCPRRPLVAVRTARSRLVRGHVPGLITPAAFLKGACLAIRSGESPATVSFSGTLAQAAKPAGRSAAAGIPGVVREDGFLPHRLALQTASSADAAPPDSAQWPAGAPHHDRQAIRVSGLATANPCTACPEVPLLTSYAKRCRLRGSSRRHSGNRGHALPNSW